jgi:hypothetical protein
MAAQSVNPFGAVWNGTMDGVMEKSASLFGKNMQTLQQESVRFVSKRIEDNLKTAQQLGACRSVPDFLAVQQKWFADMAHAYSQEWTRCSELMSEAMQGHEKVSNGDRPARPPHTH